MSRIRFHLSAVVVICSALLGGAPASHAQLSPPIPAISGSAAPGQTLTCSAASWDLATGPYAYSWQRDVVTPIGTGTHYTVTAADVGHPITCQDVVPTALGNSTFPSAPVTPVALPVAGAPIPIPGSPPTISGKAVPGQSLACSQGAWFNNPTAYVYSWQHDASTIAGQTSSTYTVASGDVGHAITCTVVASNTSGSGPAATSLPVFPSSAGGGAGGGGTGGTGGTGGGSGGTGGTSGGTGGSGTGAGGGSKQPAPRLKSLSIAPRNVVVSKRGTKRTTRGASIRYAVDRTANVLIYVQEKRHGRYQTVRVIVVRNVRAGAHKVFYNAHIGKRIVSVGTYRLVAAAANRVGWSSARMAPFKVIQKQLKPKKHRVR